MHRPEHDAKPLTNIFNRHSVANLLSIYAVVLAIPPQMGRRVSAGCNSRTLHQPSCGQICGNVTQA